MKTYLSLPHLFLLALTALQIGSVVGMRPRNPYRTYDHLKTKAKPLPNVSESYGSPKGETTAWIDDEEKEPKNPAPGKSIAECVQTARSSTSSDGTKRCLDEFVKTSPPKDKEKLFCKLHVYVACRLEAKVNEFIKTQKDLDVTDNDGVKYKLSDMRYTELDFKKGFGALGVENEPSGLWKNSYNYYHIKSNVRVEGKATYQDDGMTRTDPFMAKIDYSSGYQALTAGPLLYSEKHSPQLYVDPAGCQETKEAKKLDVLDESELLEDGKLRQRMISDICAVLGDAFTEAINVALNLFEDDNKEKELLKKLAKKVKS